MRIRLTLTVMFAKRIDSPKWSKAHSYCDIPINNGVAANSETRTFHVSIRDAMLNWSASRNEHALRAPAD